MAIFKSKGLSSLGRLLTDGLGGGIDPLAAFVCVLIFKRPAFFVGDADDLGGYLVVGEHTEGVTHHRGAHDFAEGADMWQTRGAVAGLEDHNVLRRFLQPLRDQAGLFERPSLGGGCEGGEIGHRRIQNGRSA